MRKRHGTLVVGQFEISTTFRMGHPDGPRFHQRAEGSPVQRILARRSLATPEERFRSG